MSGGTAPHTPEDINFGDGGGHFGDEFMVAMLVRELVEMELWRLFAGDENSSDPESSILLAGLDIEFDVLLFGSKRPLFRLSVGLFTFDKAAEAAWRLISSISSAEMNWANCDLRIKDIVEYYGQYFSGLMGQLNNKSKQTAKSNLARTWQSRLNPPSNKNSLKKSILQ